MPAQSEPLRGYLPTLDGWRALSITAVLLSHEQVHSAGRWNTRWFYDHGQVGVNVFFAISGLLICSRLLTEEEADGRIALRSFYLRRAFRILPPALLFLLTLAVLKRLIGLPVGIPEIAAAILFLRNYTFTFLRLQNVVPFYTSHFWSLAVEEHFYLLLPALLVYVRRSLRVPTLLIIALAVALHRGMQGTAVAWAHTDTRLDALLVPAMLAVLLRGTGIRKKVEPWLRLWPLTLILLAFSLNPVTPVGIQLTLSAWLLPIAVLGTMLHPLSWVSRLLEFAPLRYVGRLSYSLYLWQQLFFVAHWGAPAKHIGFLQHWPISMLATAGCALASYYAIERPMIQLGHKWVSGLPGDKPSRKRAQAKTLEGLPS